MHSLWSAARNAGGAMSRDGEQNQRRNGRTGRAVASSPTSIGAHRLGQQVARWLSWFCLFFGATFLTLFLVGWGPAHVPASATLSLCVALIAGSLSPLVSGRPRWLSLALLVVAIVAGLAAFAIALWP